LELGRSSKEGRKKERKNIPTSPRQKQNPKKKTKNPKKKKKNQKKNPPPPPPPPLFIYHNLLVDEIKWDSTEPRNNF
jgi:hypothetical protein